MKQKSIEMLILILSLAFGQFQGKVVYLVIGAILTVVVGLYFRRKQLGKM